MGPPSLARSGSPETIRKNRKSPRMGPSWRCCVVPVFSLGVVGGLGYPSSKLIVWKREDAQVHRQTVHRCTAIAMMKQTIEIAVGIS